MRKFDYNVERVKPSNGFPLLYRLWMNLFANQVCFKLAPCSVMTDKLDKEVAGEYNTFRTYLLLLRVGSASARRVQEQLGFSSPSLALHHLEKLRAYGLVDKDSYGEYTPVRRSFGILRLFVITGRWIIPRTVFTMVIFAVLTVGFLRYLSEHAYFAVAAALSIAGFIWSLYETVRSYRILPK